MQYGKNKDGYWDAEMFGKQIDRILDCFDCLHPDWQLCLEVRHPSIRRLITCEFITKFGRMKPQLFSHYTHTHDGSHTRWQVDWSMNHAAHRTDALSALKMNLDFGGKQPTPHDSFIDPAHETLLLGPHPAVIIIDGQPVDCKLKAGDTQRFYFRDGDHPPWYRPNAPKYDRVDAITGKVLEQGYVDKPKGKKQVLWERGWWKEGMVNKLEEDDGRDMSLSAHHVLANCWDFANETTALMEKL